jgi:hypothetical protein
LKARHVLAKTEQVLLATQQHRPPEVLPISFPTEKKEHLLPLPLPPQMGMQVFIPRAHVLKLAPGMPKHFLEVSRTSGGSSDFSSSDECTGRALSKPA